MKKLIVGFALALAMLLTPTVHAQTRVLAGLNGGDSYDNLFFGGQVAIEQQIGRHFEVALLDSFSPLEDHVALGHGKANSTNLNGIVWLTPSWGLDANATYSTYDVTKVSKGADYVQVGPILRKVVYYRPARFGINYEHQVFNGITPSGLETSHLNGIDAYFDVRLTCFGSGKLCMRIREDWTFGRVLTQGNPVCDGAFGVATCPRTPAFGGGWSGSLRFELGKRNGHQLDEAF